MKSRSVEGRMPPRLHLHTALLMVLLCPVTACDDDGNPVDGGLPETDSDVDDGGTSSDSDAESGDADSRDADSEEEPPPPPPWNTLPCEAPRYWPRHIESATYPVLIHYRLASERATAEEVLGYLETSWEIEVGELGFSAPLADEGLCGPDDRFDVFLWSGIDECYVDVFDVNPATEWNDWFSYLVLDPWGPYGGEILDSTVAHELNHACQAADDWWESELIFEATATFIEDVVFDDDDEYMDILYDFQMRPDWALDFNDEYETWYMYGASLYLHFLRERYFDGDARFVAEMWRESRNPHGEDYDPERNEPDFEDALDDLLRRTAGVDFIDTVVGFARWRWYTASRDDGRHFEEGALFPEDALVASIGPIDTTPRRVEISPAPMMLGNAYIELLGAPHTAVGLSLETEEHPEMELVLQAVPGLDEATDGERIDMIDGAASVVLDSAGRRTLIFTTTPAGEDDPDTRSVRRYPITLVFE